MTITISLVTYNCEDKVEATARCLIEATYKPEPTTKILDNGSTDETVDILRRAGFFVDISLRNVGYGSGHNANLKNETSDLFIILNPDIRFGPNIFDDIVKEFERRDDLGILLPAIRSPNGELQHLCKRNPTIPLLLLNRIERFYHPRWIQKPLDRFQMNDMSYENPFQVEFGSGCFMAIRGSVFRMINGFDERYFLYMEDADITRTVNATGFKSMYIPSVEVVHDWEGGSGKNLKLTLLIVKSAAQYTCKWRSLTRAERRPKIKSLGSPDEKA